MSRLVATIGLLVGLLFGTSAFAVSSHEVPTIKAIKKDGKVIGAELTVLLKPQGHRSALVGLGHPHQNKNTHSPKSYMHVRDKALGYIIQELGTVQTPSVTEEKFKLVYGQGNDLKTGDKVEVYSFWEQGHLFGSNRHESWAEPVYTLPSQ